MAPNRVQILTVREKQTALSGGWLDRRCFYAVDLSGAIFDQASCRDAVFIQADLRHASFHDAVLVNALFLRCDLTGAELGDASVLGARFLACTGIAPDLAGVLKRRGANVSHERVAVDGGVSRAW